mmetsp:Transcript_141584/g.250171  ORF Transcript_141584/g.250171 Transcript_141584/m.250171 type:complete len:200 (+) Transcript_141584:95-694(+)
MPSDDETLYSVCSRCADERMQRTSLVHPELRNCVVRPVMDKGLGIAKRPVERRKIRTNVCVRNEIGQERGTLEDKVQYLLSLSQRGSHNGETSRTTLHWLLMNCLHHEIDFLTTISQSWHRRRRGNIHYLVHPPAQPCGNEILNKLRPYVCWHIWNVFLQALCSCTSSRIRVGAVCSRRLGSLSALAASLFRNSWCRRQ